MVPTHVSVHVCNQLVILRPGPNLASKSKVSAQTSGQLRSNFYFVNRRRIASTVACHLAEVCLSDTPVI